MSTLRAEGPVHLSLVPRDFTHLLMNMAGVLFYELCKANVIRAQFREPAEDTGLTGVKEWKVLGHLWVKQSGS